MRRCAVHFLLVVTLCSSLCNYVNTSGFNSSPPNEKDVTFVLSLRTGRQTKTAQKSGPSEATEGLTGNNENAVSRRRAISNVSVKAYRGGWDYSGNTLPPVFVAPALSDSDAPSLEPTQNPSGSIAYGQTSTNPPPNIRSDPGKMHAPQTPPTHQLSPVPQSLPTSQPFQSVAAPESLPALQPIQSYVASSTPSFRPTPRLSQSDAPSQVPQSAPLSSISQIPSLVPSTGSPRESAEYNVSKQSIASGPFPYGYMSLAALGFLTAGSALVVCRRPARIGDEFDESDTSSLSTDVAQAASWSMHSSGESYTHRQKVIRCQPPDDDPDACWAGVCDNFLCAT